MIQEQPLVSGEKNRSKCLRVFAKEESSNFPLDFASMGLYILGRLSPAGSKIAGDEENEELYSREPPGGFLFQF
jgi:hypothetical protein